MAGLLMAAIPAAQASVIQFDDPLADEQWYLDQLEFGEAWSLIWEQQRRGQVQVAVLDSGFETEHTDLGPNLLAGINIVDGSDNIVPVHPHGTATGGIPGALSDNGSGISQSAWTARVLPIRISNRSDGAAFVTDIAAGIRFAADQGARVINISYGGVGSKTIAKAARYAYKRGALTFMAAGNSGFKTKWKNYRHLIAVGSVNAERKRSAFSTYGKFVDFVAPGENVTTLHTGNGYAGWSGTSFASPIAASVASLVLTANPELSPKQVFKIMKVTAVDLGRRKRDIEYGHGLPDAAAAVELALNTKGKYRKRYRRRGINPYIDNPWADLSLIRTFDPVTQSSPAASNLVAPQGFIISASAPAAAAAPEPATIIMLAAVLALVGARRRRRGLRLEV